MQREARDELRRRLHALGAAAPAAPLRRDGAMHRRRPRRSLDRGAQIGATSEADLTLSRRCSTICPRSPGARCRRATAGRRPGWGTPSEAFRGGRSRCSSSAPTRSPRRSPRTETSSVLECERTDDAQAALELARAPGAGRRGHRRGRGRSARARRGAARRSADRAGPDRRARDVPRPGASRRASSRSASRRR